MYIEGRLRPQKFQWQRKTEDEPYRWTYFNEDLDSTVHSQSMSGLLDSGMTFGELFRPSKFGSNNSPANGDSRSTDEYSPSRPSQSESEQAEAKSDQSTNQQQNDSLTSFYKGQSAPPPRSSKATFWLDVLSPTEAEMRLLQRTFGIHGLSAEDIMMQEPREKVELFQHYYFVSYRSFEQDASSEEYLEPVNIYTIVFKEGVLTVSVKS